MKDLSINQLRVFAEAAGYRCNDDGESAKMYGPDGLHILSGPRCDVTWEHFLTDSGPELISWAPHEDMNQAMEIVEGLLEMGCEQPNVGKISPSECFQEGTWRCTMQDKRAGPRESRISVIAATPPEAVCKAALKFLSNPE